MWIEDIWVDDGEFAPTYKEALNIKHKARAKVRYSVRAGKLKKLPCQECGDTNGIIDAHHNDYSKPLEVIWLCRKHHADLHRRIGFFQVKYHPDIV